MEERRDLNYIFREETPEEIDIKSYLFLFWNKRWLILSIVLLVFILSTIYILKQPDRYRTSSQVLVELAQAETPVNIREIQATISQMYIYITRFYRTQKYIMQSSSFLYDMVKDNKDLMSYLSAEDASSALGKLCSQITVDIDLPIDTNLININVTGRDPVLIAKAANGIAQTYMKKSITDRLYISKQIMEWFPEETERLKSQTVIGQLEELSKNEIVQILPSIAQNEVINRLKAKKTEIEHKIAELSRFYKDKFPRVAELKDELNRINSEIEVETQKVLRTLKASLTGQLQLNTIRITSYATPPGLPFWPNRPRYILSSTMVSLASALLLCIFLNYIDQRIKDEGELKKLGIPFLGYVSYLKDGIDLKKREKGIVENFSYIRTSVLFSIPADSPKVILVTSALPSDGKSTVSYFLAHALSDNKERTLIIEGDIRRPSKFLNTVKEDIGRVKGLTDFLIGNIGFESAIYSLNDYLYVAPAGFSSPNPSELLSSHKTEEFLERAAKDFDWVIVDSPPMLGIADSLILAKDNMHILLVIDTSKTDKKTISTLLDRIKSFNLRIMGTVLNRMDTSKRSYYSYYYYNKYYKRYYGGEKKDRSEISEETAAQKI